MRKLSLFAGWLLPLTLSCLWRCDAQQEMKIVNRAAQDLKFALAPVDGSWVPVEQLPESDRALAKFGGPWKDFFLPRNQTMTLRCYGCSAFHYNSLIAIHGLGDLAVGDAYFFEGGDPVFRVLNASGTIQGKGLRLDQFEPWKHFWLSGQSGTSRSIGQTAPSPATVKVTVSKVGGAWSFDAPDPMSSTQDVTSDSGLTEILCGNCRAVRVVSIDGAPVSTVLEPNVVYRVQTDYGVPKVVMTTEPYPLSTGAPAAAAGFIYIVNGQPTNLRFEFGEGTALPAETDLLGREGQSFRCIPSCVVKIKTGNSVAIRRLKPGKSYIIVFDPTNNLYDFRTYSQ
jgi:hypothetical protein